MESDRRVFTASRRVRVGDSDSNGTIRVDALARYLQDIGYDDTEDLGLGDGGFWVARSIEMNFVTPNVLPQRNETVHLATYCGGVGRAFAQRNVEITTDAGSKIETSTVWVSVNEQGKPTAVPEWLLQAYPHAQQVSSKRTLPLVDPQDIDVNIEHVPWVLRASDFDINGHVNNAVAFDALYEVASVTQAAEPAGILIEYHQPIEATDDVTLFYRSSSSGFDAWLANDKTVAAVMQWNIR